MIGQQPVTSLTQRPLADWRSYKLVYEGERRGHSISFVVEVARGGLTSYLANSVFGYCSPTATQSGTH